MKIELTTFLRILMREGLLNVRSAEDITGDDDLALDNRVRIQKYVYLAEHLGIETGYSDTYSMYLYGPYSPKLADDYFSLAEKGFFDSTKDDVDIEISNDRLAKFLDLVRDKDTDWLEIASTTLAFMHRHSSIETLVDHVTYVKEYLGKEKIKQVINELKEKNLIRLSPSRIGNR